MLAAWVSATCQALAHAHRHHAHAHAGDQHLFPLGSRSIAGLVLAATTLFISAGGGIGGGALLVPIYIIIIGFAPSSAVALSSITIVGGSLANFVLNVHRQHPSGTKPLIDWDLILVMEPTTIIGALVGSYINKVTPPWITTVLLAILLVVLSQQLLKRAVRTYKAETADIYEALEPAMQPRSETTLRTPILQRSSGEYKGDWISHSGITSCISSDDFVFDDSVDAAVKLAEIHQRGTYTIVEEGMSERVDPIDNTDGVGDGHLRGAQHNGICDQPDEVKRMLEAERRQLPWQHVTILSFLTAVVILTDNTRARVACGSTVYWIITAALLPITAVIMVGVGRWLCRKHAVKAAAKLDMSTGEVSWTPRNVVLYPAVCSLAGLVAGMFGIGGGIVKGPLMLEMGVLPDVAAASSATMILFTSISASTAYIGFGAVKADYGIVLFVIGLLLTLLGQVAAHQLMTRLKRRSIVVFSMAILITVAAAVMLVEAALQTLTAVRDGALLDRGSICS